MPALMAGRTMATLLAPVATLMASSGPGRSLFFAMERSRPWKLTRQDARQLLLNFATAPAYEETVLASMFDIPAGPISDDPGLITGLILDFLSTTAEERVLRESVPALA